MRFSSPSRPLRLLRHAGAALVALCASALAQAQSCPLCYTQAAGAGDRIIQGLRSGILVLVIPPMFMSVGITVLAYRKRNRCGTLPPSETSREDW